MIVDQKGAIEFNAFRWSPGEDSLGENSAYISVVCGVGARKAAIVIAPFVRGNFWRRNCS